MAKDCGSEEESLRTGVKAFEESVFGPGTPGRTWGTRPEPPGRSVKTANLQKTCALSAISQVSHPIIRVKKQFRLHRL
jgi:hypothetical protein